MSSSDLHETDFHAWANEQTRLIREGRLAEADLENIAEEIESMGRGEKRELVSRLDVLLLHLLKWTRISGLKAEPDRERYSLPGCHVEG